MEEYTLQSRDPDEWGSMMAVDSPRFSFSYDEDNNKVEDRRFVYPATIEDMDSDLRFVTVTIYQSSPKQADAGTPTIDTAAPRGGELLRFTNILQQGAADA